MPFDLKAVTGVWSEWTERSWTSTDALLYALAVGAGASDPAGSELDLTTENSTGTSQKVLPTFGILLGAAGPTARSIGNFNRAMLVDAGRIFELYRPIPVEGTIRSRGRITGVYDKGSGALVTREAESVDVSSGQPIFRIESHSFVRGEGGFGGERGPSGDRNAPPDRDPDHVVTYQTRIDQALLYRLTGDRNPLHSDPEFARRAGFARPILHGMCTFGFTGRALLHTLCGSDPARFRSIEGRFSKPVLPGEKLTVRMWVDGDTAIFVTESSSGQVVIDRGSCTFRLGPAV